MSVRPLVIALYPKASLNAAAAATMAEVIRSISSAAISGG
jgi:hypothetical protein